MARKATYVRRVSLKLGVYLLSHGNHHSSDFLVRIFIAREVPLYVAMVAFYA
jgi:hypothetical protein